MKAPFLVLLSGMIGCITVAAPAETAIGYDTGRSVETADELPPYLQCVPYARQVSGVAIYGDAHTWWGQAEGRFARGNHPKIGAVMAFEPHRSMRLGHVAAVSKIIDSRTILLRHANWSPINGRRGQIENDVRAMDVSPNNDWSAVRVWYDPIQALGKTAWPVHGFIYSDTAPKFEQTSRRRPRTDIARANRVRMVSKPSGKFSSAFANLNRQSAPIAQAKTIVSPREPKRRPGSRISRKNNDPIRSAVSLYD